MGSRLDVVSCSPWSIPSASTSAAPASRARPVDLDTRRLRRRRRQDRHPAPGHARRRSARSSASSSTRSRDSTAPGGGRPCPAVVRHGVVSRPPTSTPSWIGIDADALLHRRAGPRRCTWSTTPTPRAWRRCEYGAAQGRGGLVIVTTLGTGIGSALVHDGVLVPNSELGHLEIDGHDAEKSRPPTASGSARGCPGGVGAAPHDLLPDPGEALLPRADRRRRRGEQESEQVPAADRDRDRDRAGDAAQQGRHHRRGPGRDPRRRAA